MTYVQKERSYISGRNIKAMDNFDVREYQALNKVGINLNRESVNRLMQGKKSLDAMYAQDSLQPTVTTGSVGTPVQFLQHGYPDLFL